jgi:hypothetical protein
MPSVKNKIMLAHVVVYLDILEIHTKAANLNVLLTLIVLQIKLVYNINAKILVPDLVD